MKKAIETIYRKAAKKEYQQNIAQDYGKIWKV
jgi:hypothetical protein